MAMEVRILSSAQKEKAVAIIFININIKCVLPFYTSKLITNN